MGVIMRDEAEVLFANDAFYNAFIARDIVALEILWASNAQVVCIHPGWPPLYGREAVMRSWTDILSSPNSPKIVCKDAKTHFLTDNICYVTCFELIGGGATVATNMFLKEGDSWKMIHHHASPTSALPSEKDDEDPVLQ